MFTFNAILITIVSCLVFAYGYIRRKFSYWKDRNVIYEEPSFPMGNLQGLTRTRHPAEITQTLYMKYRGKDLFSGIWFFIKPAVLALDPEFIKNVLVRDFNNFPNRGFYYNAKDDPLSAHLFSIEGTQWKNLRAKLTPTFTSGKMKMMFKTISDVATLLKDTLKSEADKKSEIDIKDFVSRFSTDVIGTCAFGIECNSLKNPQAEFRVNGKTVFEPTQKQMFSAFFGGQFPKVSRALHLRIFAESVSKFFMNAVEQTVNFRKSNPVQRKDFMQLMLDIKEKDGKQIFDQNDMDDISAQAFLFFLAGFETSSTTMHFCLYELAKHPEIQNKVREEINEVLAKYDGEVTYESLLELPYLEQCINETFRKYPAVENLQRLAENDYKVPGSKHVIEKGTTVFIPVYGIHNDPDIYPNPDQFIPERFTVENMKKRHQFTFLPFGEGPRVCIGARFGQMQTRLGLVTILKNYKLSRASNTPDKIKLLPNALVLTPSEPICLKIENL